MAIVQNYDERDISNSMQNKTTVLCNLVRIKLLLVADNYYVGRGDFFLSSRILFLMGSDSMALKRVINDRNYSK